MKGNSYEAHISTEHPQARQMPWFPCPHVHKGRPCRSRASSRQGSQAPHRLALVHSALETITSSAEISNLFNRGRRIGGKDLTLIVLRNEKQHGHSGRAAFVAGKKQGNAVWRNRAKRRMRAVCQATGGPPTGYDVIFLAKKSTNTAEFASMVRSVNRAFDKSLHDASKRELTRND